MQGIANPGWIGDPALLACGKIRWASVPTHTGHMASSPIPTTHGPSKPQCVLCAAATGSCTRTTCSQRSSGGNRRSSFVGSLECGGRGHCPLKRIEGWWSRPLGWWCSPTACRRRSNLCSWGDEVWRWRPTAEIRSFWLQAAWIAAAPLDALWSSYSATSCNHCRLVKYSCVCITFFLLLIPETRCVHPGLCKSVLDQRLLVFLKSHSSSYTSHHRFDCKKALTHSSTLRHIAQSSGNSDPAWGWLPNRRLGCLSPSWYENRQPKVYLLCTKIPKRHSLSR